MRKILEKFMKKYWKNAEKTGKVREIRQSKKVGTMSIVEVNLCECSKFTFSPHPPTNPSRQLHQSCTLPILQIGDVMDKNSQINYQKITV